METTNTTRSNPLALHLSGSDGRSYEGALIQFTGGTMTAHFWGSDLPVLGLLEQVELQITGLSAPMPSLPASPIERIELNGGRAYRFGYTLTQEFQTRIPKALRSLFPFRDAHRVRPTDDEPVLAMLAKVDGDQWFEATVLDLSTAGLAVEVSRECESFLHSVSELQVELRFPSLSSGACARLSATVQNRRLRGQAIRYGMHFEPSQPDSPEDAKALGQYIVAREQHGA